MGQVKFQLEADEAKAVRSFLRVVDAQKKAENGSRKFAQAGKEANKSMIGLGSNMSSQMAGFATQILSVTAAIGTMRSAFAQWDKEREEVLRKNINLNKSFLQTVSDRGDLEHLSEIREKVLMTGKGGTSMEEGEKIYGAVGGAMPSADWKTVAAVTGKAMESRATGTDPVLFGLTMGELTKLMPDKTLDDLADLTKATTELTGRHGKRFGKAGIKAIEQFMAAGLGTAEEGLGLVLSSFESAQGAEAATQYIAKLVEDRQIKSPGLGRAWDPQQLMLKKFYDADPAARMKMLQEDKGLRTTVFGTQTAIIEAMLSRDPAAMTEMLKQSQEQDKFTTSMDLVAADKTSRETLGLEATQNKAARLEDQLMAEEARRDQLYLENIETWNLTQGMSAWQRMFHRGMYKGARFLGLDPEGSTEWTLGGIGGDHDTAVRTVKYMAEHPDEPFRPISEERVNPTKAERVTEENTEAVNRLNTTIGEIVFRGGLFGVDSRSFSLDRDSRINRDSQIE